MSANMPEMTEGGFGPLPMGLGGEDPGMMDPGMEEPEAAPEGELEDPDLEAAAQVLAEEEDNLSKAEQCLQLAETANDEEEATMMTNLAKYYAALSAVEDEQPDQADMDAFDQVVQQLQGTPAMELILRVNDLENQGGGMEAMPMEEGAF